MTKAVKGRYVTSLVLAAVLAAGLLMLIQPAQAQSEDTSEGEAVGPANHLPADMAIDKRATSRVKEGKTITYTIYVWQRGGSELNSSDDVTVTDVLPSGVRFLGVTTDLVDSNGNSDEFTCTGGSTVTCESDNLYNDGDYAVITISAKAKTRGTKVNTATVTLSNEANDPDDSNNTDTASTRVVRRR